MKRLLLLTVIAFTPTYATEDIDADQLAFVTCAILSNMNPTLQLEKINEARYKLQADPFTSDPSLIAESISLGTCELLVKNDTNWAKVTDFKRSKLIYLSNKRKPLRASYYSSDKRFIFPPDEYTGLPVEYEPASIVIENPIDISRAYKGEELSGRISGYYADCVIPKFDYIYTRVSQLKIIYRYSIKNNLFLCKTKDSEEPVYSADYANVTKDGKASIVTKKYELRFKNGKYKICFYDGRIFGCKKNIPSSQFIFSTGFVYDEL